MRLTFAVMGLSAGLAACSGGTGPEPVEPPPAVTPSPAPTAPPPAPAGVRVQADPAPPFTYWAPAGSVIRNHPTNPGIWFAELEGRQVGGYYFGDACRASEHQGLVGRSRLTLPEPPPDNWRVGCVTCPMTEDLRPDRMNVLFDEADDVIREVRCG